MLKGSCVLSLLGCDLEQSPPSAAETGCISRAEVRIRASDPGVAWAIRLTYGPSSLDCTLLPCWVQGPH